MHPNNGCLSCKLRKKKCDETKPKCRACERIGLTCSWPNRAKNATNSAGIVSVCIQHHPAATEPNHLAIFIIIGVCDREAKANSGKKGLEVYSACTWCQIIFALNTHLRSTLHADELAVEISPRPLRASNGQTGICSCR